MPINRKHAIVSGCVLAAVAGTFTSIIGRGAKANQGDSEARPAAVALVFRKPLSDTVKLSGEFRPFQEVDVHAKVAGYIRVIRVEVGDRVKQGQVLAVLEVPELRAELQGSDALVRRSQDSVRRAQSDLQRAESVHDAAHLNFSRLKEASATRPGIIAQQELDDSEARDKEAEAQISADQAALSEAENQLDVSLASQKQYTALSDYTNIVAPFDGVVTRRYADTGALVQAGTSSSTQALPVVRVAETDVFRLTLPVPESAVPQVHLGSVVRCVSRPWAGRLRARWHGWQIRWTKILAPCTPKSMLAIPAVAWYRGCTQRCLWCWRTKTARSWFLFRRFLVLAQRPACCWWTRRTASQKDRCNWAWRVPAASRSGRACGQAIAS